MKKISAILVMTAGFCWGLIGVFSKTLSSAGFSPVQITALRCVVTALSLGIYLFIFDREKLKIKPRDIHHFIETGILSIVLFNICYFITVDMVSLSVAAILLYTAPCIIMLLSVPLFKERLTFTKVLCLFMSFAGCVLVTGLGTSTRIPFVGILTGLGSGLGYALYTIFGRYALKKYHPFTVTFYTFLVAAAGILFFSHPSETAVLIAAKPSSLLFILLLGIVSTLVPFLCYTKGLEGLEAGTASIIACIEPMVAAIAGVTLFHEQLTAADIIGIVLIFTAVVLQSKSSASSLSKEQGLSS